LPDEWDARVGRQAAIGELIQALEQGGDPVTPREARKAVELILAILRSHQRGGTRVQLPLAENLSPAEERETGGGH
jgi:hypothetical protein